MRKKQIWILILILAGIAQGCKKYDYGPSLSLRSKTTRVVGKWVTNKWIIDKTDLTSFLNIDRRVEFTDDGVYRFKEYGPSEVLLTDMEGNWAFRQGKDQLLLGLPSGTDNAMNYVLWDVIKLRNKELWLEMVDYGYPTSVITEWQLKAE